MKRVARARSDAPAAGADPSRGILVPGRNCWRVERAHKLRCVQDGEEFFRLVREAILKARRTVFIVGWDIAAGVDLLPGESAPDAPKRLGELLDFVVRRRRHLHCFVLIWDYSAVYALERDPFSRIKLGWGTHWRVHFRYDAHHPFGASHHQKIVVVDDELAFSGGLDLTAHRWDTPRHEIGDPLRANLAGQLYEPFHDVQALVEGPVAASLGELARERWHRRTGARLPPIRPSQESLWPASVEPDLTDVDVAIARTVPAFRREPPVRECEALFLDSIAAARETIYIENQYFTSGRIGEALAARLREKDGPEVIVVGPKACSGWLEQKTMGAMRRAVLITMRDADLHGRLRVYHAAASRERCIDTFVHAKIMVIDGEFARIGSANLSNRSLGMDTECDVALEARGDPRIRAGILRIRDRLVAEHVGATGEDVARAVKRAGSLRGAIDALSAGDRALVAIDVDEVPDEEPWEPVKKTADPTEPMRVTRAIDRLLPEIEADDRDRGNRIAPVSVILVVLLFAWEMLNPQSSLREHGVRPLLHLDAWEPAVVAWVLLAFVGGGLLFVPLEILVLAAVVAFGAFAGGVLSLAGAFAGAFAGYAVGRALGFDRLVPIVGRRAYRLWGALRGRGATSVALTRFVSVASATTVHLLSGAAHVRMGEYALGTLLGLAPGILALCLLGGLLRRVILDPSPWNVTFTALASLVLAALVLRLRSTLLMKQLRPTTLEHQEGARFG